MTPLAWLTPRHAMTALVAICACILIRHDATIAILALALVAALAAMTVALIGGNAIRDDLRRRIDGLNGECARRGAEITRLEGVQDHLTAELHAERRRGQMRVVQDTRETR